MGGLFVGEELLAQLASSLCAATGSFTAAILSTGAMMKCHSPWWLCRPKW